MGASERVLRSLRGGGLSFDAVTEPSFDPFREFREAGERVVDLAAHGPPGALDEERAEDGPLVGCPVEGRAESSHREGQIMVGLQQHTPVGGLVLVLVCLGSRRRR